MRAKANAVESALGSVGGKGRGKAQVHEMHIKRAHGAGQKANEKPTGYIVRHEYRHESGETAHDHPMHGREHIVGSAKELQQHVMQHFGGGDAGEAEENAKGEE